MAKTRLDKTLADYVVISICPALIMTLVGSLVFFLLELSYRGQFESRMHWIMFWFVLAAVLVARIAIQEGREHAQMYGLAMGAATAVAVWRFVDAVFVGWCLLGVVWWCSSKLTWDCTLIDESEDASGEGLLQAAGLENGTLKDSAEPALREDPSQNERSSNEQQKKKGKKPKVSTDAANFKGDTPREADDIKSDQGKSRPHAPGLWVVYFSLAALPLFGVGQLLIPASDAARRSYAFQLLAVYVASAIALLLMTSFLGLRRYLRQRKLEMPASMARSWLGMGLALLVALMLCAVVIPRPQGEYTITAMIDEIDTKVRQASKFAMLKGGRAAGEGRRIGDQDAKTKQPGEGQPPDQKQAVPAQNGTPGGKASGNVKQGKPGNQADKNDRQSDGKSAENLPGKTSDQPRQKTESVEKKEVNSQTTSQDRRQQSTDAQRRDLDQKRADPKDANQQNRNTDQNQEPQTPSQPTTTAPSTSMLSILASWIGSLTKWIIYGLLAIVGVFFVIRYWSQFVEFLMKLWAELLSLFGRKQQPTAAAGISDTAETAVAKRPFASFKNPFSSGAAERMTSPQLIRYTFEALEAWSREQAVERHPEQTPLEFADELGRRMPTLANDVAQAARLYVQIAYAGNVPKKERLDALARLWRRLNA